MSRCPPQAVKRAAAIAAHNRKDGEVMTRYIARPTDEDGRDRMGSLGTVAGDYQSFPSCLRYMLERRCDPAETYNVYTVTGAQWRHVATYCGTIRLDIDERLAKESGRTLAAGLVAKCSTIIAEMPHTTVARSEAIARLVAYGILRHDYEAN